MPIPANTPLTVEDAQELTAEDLARLTLGEAQGDDYDTRNSLICVKPQRTTRNFTNTTTDVSR